jgi:hypothetical protein
MINPVLMEKLSKYENQERARQRAAIQQINEIERLKRPKQRRRLLLNPFNGLVKLFTKLTHRQEIAG